MESIRFNSERIINYFKGKDSDEDTPYIDEVFLDNTKEEELKSLLSKQFDELLPEDDLDNKNLDHILHRIHYDINTRLSAKKVGSFDNIIKWTLRIAGVMIIPIIIFIGIQSYKDAFLIKEAWVEIKAPAWTRAHFSLPDGTTGWLNSNSSLKYNGNFYDDRQLTLTGEAFFDVFKDKNRPFKVSTNEVVVTAIGTRFNIASYDNEKDIEVVLDEGVVIFKSNVTDISYKMSPNDLVIYHKGIMDFSTEIVQPQKYFSWTEGKLVFRNDPLDVIARRLERWYNVEVEVNVSLAEDLRLRATFINESLEEVLDLLKRSLPVDCKIENRNLKPDDSYSKTRVIILPRKK